MTSIMSNVEGYSDANINDITTATATTTTATGSNNSNNSTRTPPSSLSIVRSRKEGLQVLARNKCVSSRLSSFRDQSTAAVNRDDLHVHGHVHGHVILEAKETKREVSQPKSRSELSVASQQQLLEQVNEEEEAYHHQQQQLYKQLEQQQQPTTTSRLVFPDDIFDELDHSIHRPASCRAILSQASRQLQLVEQHCQKKALLSPSRPSSEVRRRRRQPPQRSMSMCDKLLLSSSPEQLVQVMFDIDHGKSKVSNSTKRRRRQSLCMPMAASAPPPLPKEIFI